MHPARVQVHTDFEDRHWWFVGRRRILRRISRWLLPPGTDRVVVDVGCGTGANIASLADDYRCFGIDPTAEAIQSARARFPRVTFVCGNAPAAFDELHATPDMILMMDVIEHVEDDAGLFRAVLEASAPGTLFYITVPANPSLWTIHDEAFGHYRRYEVGALRNVWAELPVTELLVSHYNHHLYPVVRGVRWVNRLRGSTSGSADTDFSMPPAPINRLLTTVFSSEARVLQRAVREPAARTFATGVSLIAVLRREDGAS